MCIIKEYSIETLPQSYMHINYNRKYEKGCLDDEMKETVDDACKRMIAVKNARRKIIHKIYAEEKIPKT